MTDTFVPSQSAPAKTFDDNSNADGGEQNVDTKSTEYQLQVMQQRLADKDAFIEQLKSENQSTREEVASMAERLQNIENISEALRNKQDTSNQDTTLDESEIVGKVIESLNAKQTQQTYEQNFAQVQQALVEKYGSDHVDAKVQEAAQANGMTFDSMVDLAKQSPAAFHRLMGDSQPTQSPTPTHGTVVAPTGTGEVRDKAFFAKMHRENPREFYKPEVQKEFRLLFTGNNN